MEKLIKSGDYLSMVCLAAVFVVAGCSTTGMQRSEAVQSSMQRVDNDIKFIIVQIDAIGASLNELTKPGQADLKRAFDLYSENVSEIEKMENDFSKHADEMESDGRDYFAEWDKTSQDYDNPEIQRQSEARRAELAVTYDQIAQNSIGVKEAFRTYVSDVNEVERFLSNDLTRDGLDAITRTTHNVVSNGSRLKNELQNLQSAIEDAREKMRQS